MVMLTFWLGSDCKPWCLAQIYVKKKGFKCSVFYKWKKNKKIKKTLYSISIKKPCPSISKNSLVNGYIGDKWRYCKKKTLINMAMLYCIAKVLVPSFNHTSWQAQPGFTHSGVKDILSTITSSINESPQHFSALSCRKCTECIAASFETQRQTVSAPTDLQARFVLQPGLHHHMRGALRVPFI